MKKNSDRQNLRLPRLLAGLVACSCLALGACGDAELVLENWPVDEEGQFEIPAEEDAGGTPSGGIDSDAGEPGPAETADSGAEEEADAGAVVPIGADSGAGGEEDADSGEPPEADDAGGGEEEEDAGAQEEPDAGPPPPDPLAWVPACSSNCPKVIESLPYSGTGDTRQGLSLLDSYSCASDISEAGPEEVYVFHVEEPGTFVAGLTEPKNGDVDIHLLTQNSASSCLRRSDKGVSAHLEPGVYYLALDTYSSASKAGAYGLYAAFYADGSKCGMNAFDMERVNDSTPLPMPATGRVVKEAHLVTVSDQSANGGSSWWPSTGQEYLSEHKARTASLTGAWAPKGEGGCE